MTNRDGRLRRYLARGHRKVYGFRSNRCFPLIRALDAVQRDRGIGGPVGEIGVFHGRLFFLLALFQHEGETALAVDMWEPAQEMEMFLENMETHLGGDDGVTVIRSDSTKLSAEDLLHAAGGPMRIISVDGGHTADVVEHDLSLARDTLAAGGVIVLDDYFQEHLPGVSEGTNRFFIGGGARDLVPFAIGANKVLIAQSSHADTYRRALEAWDFGAPTFATEMFGSPVTCIRFGFYHVLGINVGRAIARTPFWRSFRDSPMGRFIRFKILKRC